MKKQKGVSPVIAAILLILITMSIGSLFYGWMRTFYDNQLQKQSQLSDEQIQCSEAGFQINSCSFDSGDTNIATILLENTGYVDLNSFTVAALHTDGASDVNIGEIDLEEGGYGNVYVQVEAGKSISKIKVVSRDCKTIEDTTSSC